jgi:hypothetical protein
MEAEKWSSEEFGNADFGDARRSRRLVLVAAHVLDAPAGKVTESFDVPCERQGAYRLLENEAVDPKEARRAATAACVDRCKAYDFVFVPEDGSSLNITDVKGVKGTGFIGARAVGAHGLLTMSAMAVSPRGVPLGTLGQIFWTRNETEERPESHLLPIEEKESRFWPELMGTANAAFSGLDVRPWFQLDRGADGWAVFEWARKNQAWITVRSCHNRRLVGPVGQPARYLEDAVAETPLAGWMSLPVSARAGVRARVARLEVRFAEVTLQTQDQHTRKRRKEKVWVVDSREVDAPEKSTPLHWRLLTTRPTRTIEDALLVLRGYSMRWKIEEFHRAWKTAACDVEESQLRTGHGLELWATILTSVAHRLLRLTYLSRHEPELPATEEFTSAEIHAVYFAEGKRWDGVRPPTISELTRRIAFLGGYTGKSSGGPPGMVVIRRGLERIEPIVPLVPLLLTAPSPA